ncbi:hypothetical protein ACOSQ3_004806 [Xanthoceras sorbifolium]
MKLFEEEGVAVHIDGLIKEKVGRKIGPRFKEEFRYGSWLRDYAWPFTTNKEVPTILRQAINKEATVLEVVRHVGETVGELLQVCPARSDGHSQGTVRFGSSGVAPPQRPHGFASPPPNQDLNQLLILKY